MLARHLFLVIMSECEHHLPQSTQSLLLSRRREDFAQSQKVSLWW
jgi:hypothetical protein